MMYLVQGWKDNEFVGMVVTVAELSATVDTLTQCNVFLLRVNNSPIPVWIEQSFDFGIWVYDRYNNVVEMYFYNGTNETEE